jgi:hypothetical protein
MDQFARIVVGYHGCTADFARDLLLGTMPVAGWQPSANDWDWLGHGINFWEHSPDRALRWAKEKHIPNGVTPGVIGALVQLGRSFDLLDEAITSLLAQGYARLHQAYTAAESSLPQNDGKDAKRRRLDCLVINDHLRQLRLQGIEYDTVRAAFLEGEPAYPGAGFSREAHIQIAVRNPACILGVFRPNLTV